MYEQRDTNEADHKTAAQNQLAIDGLCFISFMAIKADRAGADAIKTPTLVESELVKLQLNLGNQNTLSGLNYQHTPVRDLFPPILIPARGCHHNLTILFGVLKVVVIR